MKPNIFEYEDYRMYLRDLYAALKKSKRAFSFRFFSREAGFKSPNFLQLVIEGKRNLSADSIPKFIKALRLNQQEAEFFESLVLFGQAEAVEAKNRFYERMTKSRRYREIKGVERDQFEFYSRWYYSAIRELVTLSEFKEDPVWMASQLTPAITTRQATNAIDLLLRLGLLQRRPDGRLIQSHRAITTGAEVRSLAVKNFHRVMLEVATSSIDRIPAAERDISGVTLGIPASRVGEIKEKISRFRQELLATLGSSKEPSDRVYQLNVQLFPLTERGKRK